MSDSVVKFYPANAGNNPDMVLEQAVGEYDSLIIIGYDKDGRLDVRSTLNLDHANVLWLIELFKAKLLRGDYGDVEE